MYDRMKLNKDNALYVVCTLFNLYIYSIFSPHPTTLRVLAQSSSAKIDFDIQKQMFVTKFHHILDLLVA